MDLTYRFRYLLYFALFVMVMSVCFVYAEPAPQSHLLFQVTPQHASFLVGAPHEPRFDPAALRTATTPAVSQGTLRQVLIQAHPRHNLLHRARRVPAPLGPALEQNESSALPATPAAATGHSIHQ